MPCALAILLSVSPDLTVYVPLLELEALLELEELFELELLEALLLELLPLVLRLWFT